MEWKVDLYRRLWLKTVVTVLTLTAVFFQSSSVSAAVELSSDAGTVVCSGTEVTFTCTASTGIVRWRYSESPTNAALDFTSGMEILGPFTVAPVTGNNTFLISTATAAITEGVNGSLSCEDVLDPTANDSITIPGIRGPPSFLPNLFVSESTIMSVGANQWQFNLEWDVSPEDCNLEYVITIDPPLPPPLSDCTVDCTTQCRTFTLERDDHHNFTVFAQNCGGTQNGSESEPIPVCFELPDAPDDVWSQIGYQKRGLDTSAPGELASIMLSWSPVPDPKDPAPGVDGSITGYQVSVTGMAPMNLPSSELSYEVNVTGDNSTEFTVSVTARNTLGLGDTTTVGPYSPSDELLDVRINYCGTVSTAEVYCSFPREEFISDLCTFEYWTDPDDHIVQTINSQSSNGIMSPLSVKLMPGTLYYYRVSASNESLLLNVTVQGTFLAAELGCDPAVLGVPDEEASVACKSTAYLGGVKLQDGSGRVCYSATSPGSVAAYICENGYSGNHTDVTVCGTNLTWIKPKICVAIISPPSDGNLDGLSMNGRVATYSCDSALYELEGSSSIIYDEENGWPDAPTCKVVGWIVFLIILVLLLTIMVVILVAALIYTIVLLRKQGAVSLTTPRETVEMKENMSYGPVRVQSQPATQEPVYEEADTLQQPAVHVHTGGNIAYGHIRP